MDKNPDTRLKAISNVSMSLKVLHEQGTLKDVSAPDFVDGFDFFFLRKKNTKEDFFFFSRLLLIEFFFFFISIF